MREWLRRKVQQWLGMDLLIDDLHYWRSRADSSERHYERVITERDQYKYYYDYLMNLEMERQSLLMPAPIVIRKESNNMSETMQRSKEEK